MIPKKIYQTHKSKEFIEKNKRYHECYLTWDVDGYEHIFYNDEEADIFMKDNFKEIYDVYKSLPLPVMKADLWRYCIVYHYGGIYADMDTIFKGDDLDYLFQKDSDLILTTEYPQDINFCQWVFAAPKGSVLLKAVIEESVNRIVKCKDFKFEHMVHELTGPSVFTEAIESVLLKYNLETFGPKDRKKYTDSYKNKIMYVHESHNLFYNHIEHIYSGQWEDGWISDVNEFTGIEHIKVGILDKEGRRKK
jgi:alpha 1,6-mannosyltransferase